MLPQFRRFEAEDDVIPRDARVNKLLSHAVFSAVILNPDFVVYDIDVNHAIVDSALILTPKSYQKVTIVFAIENDFLPKISV